jgi:hypothetical protein
MVCGMGARAVDWWVAGSYFEACNCEAVCPCRRMGDRPGGRSTYGHCDFALSWAIEEGQASGLDLAGLNVVMVGRYGDEPGLVADLPVGAWEVALYLDERASPAQAAALEAIFLGRAGGTPVENFAAAIGRVHHVGPAVIDLDHAHGRQAVQVANRVEVRARSPVHTEEAISCAIPGHDQPGEEWVADVLRVDEGPLSWEVVGRCAFATRFRYEGAAAPMMQP